MKHLTRRARLCSLMAAGPLVAGSMALPAHAVPVFTVSAMTAYSSAYSSAKDPCTLADNPSPVLVDAPVAENGAPTSFSTSNSGTVTRDGDDTDVISFATSSTIIGRVTSVGGNPGVIEVTTSGSVQADTTKPTSSCEVTADGVGYLHSTFTVAQGGFMTFTTKATRHGFGSIRLDSSSTSATAFEVGGTGLSFSGVNSVYLPPGTYDSLVEADARIVSATTVPLTPVAVSIKGTFAVAGSQTKAVSGTGQKYLTFPATRSCATGSVDAAVTGKGKRAKQIRKVRLFVNDAKVRSLTTPKKGQLVKLPVTDEADAEVLAEVTLKPSKPGREPKTHEVTVGYIACSAS